MEESPASSLTVPPVEPETAWEVLGQFGGHVLFLADPYTRIRFVTPNVEGLLGKAPGALVGESMMDLYHAEDLARIGDGYEAALYGGELVLARHRCVGIDGRQIWVESTSRAVRFEGEQFVLVALRREPGNPEAAWTRV